MYVHVRLSFPFISFRPVALGLSLVVFGPDLVLRIELKLSFQIQRPEIPRRRQEGGMATASILSSSVHGSQKLKMKQNKEDHQQ